MYVNYQNEENEGKEFGYLVGIHWAAYGHEEVVTKPEDQDNECNMLMATKTIKLEEN